ncbi:hypothetical protein, partial [Thermomonas sp.]|uniref:hypothetical protein n=1 Tax=Thermomonas sp. TaxID=1971895 RepID=UPI002487B070
HFCSSEPHIIQAFCLPSIPREEEFGLLQWLVRILTAHLSRPTSIANFAALPQALPAKII